MLDCTSIVDFYELLGRFAAADLQLEPFIRLSFAPVVRGVVVGSFATRLGSIFLPSALDQDKWGKVVSKPFLNSELEGTFGKAIGELFALSAAHSGCDRAMNDEESSYVAAARVRFQEHVASLTARHDELAGGALSEALDFLSRTSQRLSTELDPGLNALTLAAELAGGFRGVASDLATEVLAHRIQLAERDIELQMSAH